MQTILLLTGRLCKWRFVARGRHRPHTNIFLITPPHTHLYDNGVVKASNEICFPNVCENRSLLKHFTIVFNFKGAVEILLERLCGELWRSAPCLFHEDNSVVTTKAQRELLTQEVESGSVRDTDHLRLATCIKCLAVTDEEIMAFVASSASVTSEIVATRSSGPRRGRHVYDRTTCYSIRHATSYLMVSNVSFIDDTNHSKLIPVK